MTSLDDLKHAIDRLSKTTDVRRRHGSSHMVNRWFQEDVERVYRTAIFWRDGASPGTAEYLEGMSLISSFMADRACGKV